MNSITSLEGNNRLSVLCPRQISGLAAANMALDVSSTSIRASVDVANHSGGCENPIGIL